MAPTFRVSRTSYMSARTKLLAAHAPAYQQKDQDNEKNYQAAIELWLLIRWRGI